jgi:hypothetical protein
MEFPGITGKSLNGAEVTLPDAAIGKVALIIVAFVRQPPGVVDSWLAPFEKEFSHDKSYVFYEIPMLEGVWAKTISGIIEGGMRQGIPERMHDNVVSYYGGAEAYCAALEINDKSRCYVFLLDRHGSIIWRSVGTASDAAVKEMLRLAQELKDQ